MFRRSEKASKCIQMLKKRVVNSPKSVKMLTANTQEESFTENDFFAKELKKVS